MSALQPAPARSLASRFYPEISASGFSRDDGSVTFYSQVAALLAHEHRVLDFGAGRGELIADDPVPFRRWLTNPKGRCAHVEGCDVDPVVLDNPFLDGAKVIEIGEPLPYADASFDLVLSRYVFEHVDTPGQTAAELLRVTKPGGGFAQSRPMPGATLRSPHGWCPTGSTSPRCAGSSRTARPRTCFRHATR